MRLTVSQYDRKHFTISSLVLKNRLTTILKSPKKFKINISHFYLHTGFKTNLGPISAKAPSSDKIW